MTSVMDFFCVMEIGPAILAISCRGSHNTLSAAWRTEPANFLGRQLSSIHQGRGSGASLAAAVDFQLMIPSTRCDRPLLDRAGSCLM